MPRKKNNTKNNPYIFTKKINIGYKLVPFNLSLNDVGFTKYLPPIVKEWKNSVYNYNSNNTINFPVYDLNLNSLIKSYFNLYFNHKYLKHKYISRKKKRMSFKKIFVSKAEIKHTNSKAIVTIYIYNKEKLILLEKIWKLSELLVKFMILLTDKNKLVKFISLPWIINQDLINNSSILWRLANYKVRDDFIKVDNFLYIRIKRLANNLYKILTTIRRYRLRLSLNRYKLEEQLLYKLSQLISKYYGKKVELNIVNLNSIAYNGDIFTEILTSKIKKEKSGPIFNINALLSKIVLPGVNTNIKRGRLESNVDLDLIDNKFINFNVSSIINNNNKNLFKDSLNKLLFDLYYKTTFEKENKLNEVFTDKSYYLKIRDIILDNIKYKNMYGARLIVKGRLTRRYRADRAIYKIKWKGGLKNIDSAFRGLSTVTFRGFMDSNVERSIFVSKRRIGSFGVKTWIAGRPYTTMANR